MTEREILEAALAGLQIQLARVDGQIQHVRRLMKPSQRWTATVAAAPTVTEPVATGMAHRQRHMSAAGRKAISRAAKRRWAKWHRNREAGGAA